MIFPPIPLGTQLLAKDTLAQDKKNCRKIGPCGLGKKALYVNSFYLDRRYYVRYSEIRRCFKRVAMSKGGFTGKGAFGSLPYLVVQLTSGKEKQCNFKFEEQVDTLLEYLGQSHPEIKRYSAEAEKKLLEAEAKERARYVKVLEPEAKEAWDELLEAQNMLKKKADLGLDLSAAARQKRSVDHVSPFYKIYSMTILVLALAAALFGIYAFARQWGFAVYFVLFGLAGIFTLASAGALPTGRNNKRAADREWRKAVQANADYIKGYEKGNFPLPAQYAHPVVIERMIRVIREGRAKSIPRAYEVMKEDLKALNSSVKVSQKEYDEVVAVKPMFLLCDYQDTWEDEGK